MQQPNVACLTCHVYGSVSQAAGKVQPFATSYSFMFGHAQAPKK
jgi:hypothetical protein